MPGERRLLDASPLERLPPELAGLVAAHLPRADLDALATTSRRTFALIERERDLATVVQEAQRANSLAGVYEVIQAIRRDPGHPLVSQMDGLTDTEQRELLHALAEQVACVPDDERAFARDAVLRIAQELSLEPSCVSQLRTGEVFGSAVSAAFAGISPAEALRLFPHEDARAVEGAALVSASNGIHAGATLPAAMARHGLAGSAPEAREALGIIAIDVASTAVQTEAMTVDEAIAHFDLGPSDEVRDELINAQEDPPDYMDLVREGCGVWEIEAFAFEGGMDRGDRLRVERAIVMGPKVRESLQDGQSASEIETALGIGYPASRQLLRHWARELKSLPEPRHRQTTSGSADQDGGSEASPDPTSPPAS